MSESSEWIHSDEGLTLKTLVFESFIVASLVCNKSTTIVNCFDFNPLYSSENSNVAYHFLMPSCVSV